MCQQDCLLTNNLFLVPSNASKNARTSPTSTNKRKPMEEQKPRYITGSSMVHDRCMTGTNSALFSWLQKLSEKLDHRFKPLINAKRIYIRAFQVVNTCRVQTWTHTGRVGSARRRADGGAGQCWAKQGADISVALEANRPSCPPAHCKNLF